MRHELTELRPTLRIEVINRGRLGDTIVGAIARFERDVLAYWPDLVVWQLGTNDVVWGGRAEGHQHRIIEGVRALKGIGADVILMDLQYARMVLASSQHSDMQAIISEATTARACRPISTLLLCAARSRQGCRPALCGIMGRAAQFRRRL